MSLPYSSQPPRPAGHPRPIPAGYGGGDPDTSAGAESQVPAPRPSRRVRRKASRALRGVRTRRDQRPEPREGKAGGAPLGGRALRRRPPSLVSRSRLRGPHRWLAGRASGRGGLRARRLPAWASLFRLALSLGVWAQPALGAAFSRPGLSRLSLSPSPFALLSSFLAFSLRRAPLLSPLVLQALLDCARVPGSAWSPRREAETSLTPNATLTRSSRSAFAGSGPRPERWKEKGDSGDLPSACP